MGEVEKTLERLNEALVKAGFPKAVANALYKSSGGGWDVTASLNLLFDVDGKYIEPKDGEC